MAEHGKAWRGKAWRGRLGTAWPGEAGRGKAGKAGRGEAWQGAARHGRQGVSTATVFCCVGRSGHSANDQSHKVKEFYNEDLY